MNHYRLNEIRTINHVQKHVDHRAKIKTPFIQVDYLRYLFLLWKADQQSKLFFHSFKGKKIYRDVFGTLSSYISLPIYLRL
jgi:hypothetical protein